MMDALGNLASERIKSERLGSVCLDSAENTFPYKCYQIPIKYLCPSLN